jgi:hypothetical protein
MCEASLGEWIRTGAAAISPPLVVLGWWWVNRQSNERERRKELRQLVDRALETVKEAVEVALRYHGGTDGASVDQTESWKLLLAVNEIKNQLNLLMQHCLDTEPCIGPFLRLKQATTGHDFMTAGYKPWDSKDKRWLVLIDSATSLKHNLDVLFFKNFGK